MDYFNKNFFGYGGRKPEPQNDQQYNYPQSRQGNYRNDDYPKVTQADMNQLKQTLAEFGMEGQFTDNQIMVALKSQQCNQEKAMDLLLSGGIQNEEQKIQRIDSTSTAVTNNQPQNNLTKSADLSASKNMVQNPFVSNPQAKPKKPEPIPQNERFRDPNLPCGLKNVGNTCYFASLMQVLFHLPNMQEKLLKFNPQRVPEQWNKIDEAKLEEVEKIKMKKSKELVVEVKELFAKMLLSNIKYQDPTKLLESIVDDNGVGISIYEQKDIGEFFLNFLDRMQDGLCENKAIIRKLMSTDLAQDINEQRLNTMAPEKEEDSVQVPSMMSFDQNRGPGQSIGPEEFRSYQNPQENNDKLGTSTTQINSSHGDIDLSEVDEKIIDNTIENYRNNPRRDGGAQMASLYFNSQNQSQFLRHQSIVDPDKDTILMNYDLEQFKNSMWENFLGSQVQISKVVEEDGTYKITNRNVDKMGPVQLRIEEGNLYQAWEKSRRSEIDGYQGDKPGQKKKLETWICRPPNVMMFQLNRVQFDMNSQKLVKDNSEFQFDKEIYLDLFLNQNKERSDTHLAEFEVMKKQLKKLKDEYDSYVQGDIVQKLKDCQAFIESNSKQEVQGAGSGDPKPQTLDLGIPFNQVSLALEVMAQYEKAQNSKVQILKEKIEKLEKQVEKPYIKNKEQPYQLHAIMIHDGLAENGHYYTYVYDRKLKVWWCMNDHLVTQVEEEVVMQEALGSQKQYKSACNLFYINRHIAQIIDSTEYPVFTENHAKTLNLQKEMLDNIKKQNYAFELEVQSFVIKQTVDSIIDSTKQRLHILDNQEQNLDQIVQLKLYSFTQFLKSVEFKGYAKWVILNQAVKENHPQKMSLEDIQQYMATHEGHTDEIYSELQHHYPDKFMQLTQGEQKSISYKQNEYKILLKKSLYLTYMFINTDIYNIKSSLSVYLLFKNYCDDLKDKISNYARISDYDSMSYEIIQIFVFNLMINILFKYRSSKVEKRQDAKISVYIATMIIHQLFDKKKQHYRQLEYIYQEVVSYHKRIRGHKECHIGTQEMDWYADMFQKLKRGQFLDSETIHFDPSLPEEISSQFQKIDQLNCMEFVDGIDTESLSYKYYNSLNQFRVNYNGQINLHSQWLQKGPWSEQNMLYYVQRNNISLPMQLFDSNYSIKMVLGKPENEK